VSSGGPERFESSRVESFAVGTIQLRWKSRALHVKNRAIEHTSSAQTIGRSSDNDSDRLCEGSEKGRGHGRAERWNLK
jgi:hypothetical protein